MENRISTGREVEDSTKTRAEQRKAYSRVNELKRVKS
jgi:hypothetical protein